MNSLKPTIYSTHSQTVTRKCTHRHAHTNKNDHPCALILEQHQYIQLNYRQHTHTHTRTHTHIAPAKRFHSLSSISTANSTIDSFLKHEPVCFFHICTDQTQKEGQRKGGGSGIGVTGLQTWNPNQMIPRTCSTCTQLLQEMKVASAGLDHLREI